MGKLREVSGVLMADVKGQQTVMTDNGQTHFLVGPQRAKSQVGERVTLRYITSPSSGMWYAQPEVANVR